jgi:hypothetical protein
MSKTESNHLGASLPKVSENEVLAYLLQGEGGFGPREYCEMTLGHLLDFLTLMDRLITEKERTDIEEIKQNSRGPVDWAEEDPYWWEDIVRDQFRPAFVILLLSATERHLKHLCDRTATILQIEKPDVRKSDDKKSRQGTIAKYRDFFNKSAGFSSPSNKIWDQVIGLYHLRNTIAHQGSLITKPKQLNKIRKPLISFPGISFDSGGLPCIPEIKMEFCFFSHNFILKLFDNLHRQYQDFCQRRSLDLA